MFAGSWILKGIMKRCEACLGFEGLGAGREGQQARGESAVLLCPWGAVQGVEVAHLQRDLVEVVVSDVVHCQLVAIVQHLGRPCSHF